MPSPINMREASKGALLGGLGAGVVSVGIYFVARALGADFRPKDPQMMMGLEVLPPFQPMVNCMVAALVSIALLALLVRFAGDKAWPIFLGIASLVFLGEAFAPFWAFGDPKTILALETMHVPAALGVIGGLRFFGRPVAVRA